MLNAAFYINSQGEFFDPVTGGWDWENVLTLAGLWWLVTGPPPFLIFYILNWLGRDEWPIKP